MTTSYKPGDDIRGERVVCTCRKVKIHKPIQLTSAHKGNMVTLTRDVRCVIEREFIMIKPDSTTTRS